MIKDKFNRLKKKGMVFDTIEPLLKYNTQEYELMKKEKSDRVVVVSGYEGSGKSVLAMHLHDNWYNNVLKDVEFMHETFCFTDVDWGKALMAVLKKPNRMISHDEAVNILYRKEGTTKKNKEINKAFKKFRGKQWYHLMLIPQLHRMDKEMVEDRVRSLLFVFSYGPHRYVAVYTKKRLDSLIAEISRMIESTAKDVKSRPQVLNCETDPAMICRIPMYEGELINTYSEDKERNMDESVEAVNEVLSGKLDKEVKVTKKSLLMSKAMKMLESKTQKEVAEALDVSLRTIQSWVYEERDKNTA